MRKAADYSRGVSFDAVDSDKVKGLTKTLGASNVNVRGKDAGAFPGECADLVTTRCRRAEVSAE